LNRINDGSRILVFCETKKGVDELTKLLRCDGWHAVRGIHGDKSQSVSLRKYEFQKIGKRLSI